MCLTPTLAAQCPFNLALAENKEAAQNDTSAATADTPAVQQRIVLPGLSTEAVRRTFTLGLGHNHLLDTYLSPLNYAGMSLSVAYRSERQSRWVRSGRLTQWWYVQAAYTDANKAVGAGTMHDGEIALTYGLHYNRLLWQADDFSALRLGIGPALGLHLGGTYNDRNGNNPAQARVAIDLGLSAVADYRFRLLGTRWQWHTQAELPLVGLMFTPHYGESYYQLFALQHGRRNIVAATPFTAPSILVESRLSLPFLHRRFSIGLRADVRQSHVNGLKRHAWNTSFLLGYTRTLQFFDR